MYLASSQTWSMVAGHKLLCEGLGWLVGDRRTTCFWTDHWLGSWRLLDSVLDQVPLQDLHCPVWSYWKEEGGWNLASLKLPLPPDKLNLLQLVLLAEENVMYRGDLLHQVNFLLNLSILCWFLLFWRFFVPSGSGYSRCVGLRGVIYFVDSWDIMLLRYFHCYIIEGREMLLIVYFDYGIETCLSCCSQLSKGSTDMHAMFPQRFHYNFFSMEEVGSWVDWNVSN